MSNKGASPAPTLYGEFEITRNLGALRAWEQQYLSTLRELARAMKGKGYSRGWFIDACDEAAKLFGWSPQELEAIHADTLTVADETWGTL